MASVVIIHAAEDALPARALAEKLARAGMRPVFDTPAGPELREAIRSAAAVMALWSPRSNTQFDLIAEARFARELKAVIHARMQNAPCPDPFADDVAIDLTGWRGEDDFPAWRSLARAIAEAAGLEAPSAPATRTAGGFFNPGAGAAPAPAAPPRSAAAPAPSAYAETRAAPTSSAPRASDSRFEPIDTAEPSEAPPARPEPAPMFAHERDSSERERERERPAYDPPPVDYEPERARGGGGGGGGFFMGALAAVVLLGAGGAGGYFYWNATNGANAGSISWSEVDKSDPYALRAYLKNASPGANRDMATAALESLEGERLAEARAVDSIEAYQVFLAEFPESQQAIAVRGRIAELRAMPSAPAEGEAQLVDPATGLPIAGEPLDPDLVPPGSIDHLGPLAPPPGAQPAPAPLPGEPGGPVSLTPPAPPESETPEMPEEPESAGGPVRLN